MKRLLLAVALSLVPSPALAAVGAAGARASEILDGSFAGRPLPMLLVLAGLSLIPFAVVLSIARSALGSQQVPPTSVLTGLALILTLHVMSPVFEDVGGLARAGLERAQTPSQSVAALLQACEPMRAFLLRHGHPEDRALFLSLAQQLRGPARAAEVGEEQLSVALPAFLVSELKEAFQIGFLVFLPFLVLDMVIANLLMALGMQSLSPTSVSLPFKLLLFVAVDGWQLLSQGLVLGYR